MTDLLFGGGAGWFTTLALVGTAFFALRLAMMFVGGHSMDIDFDIDHTDSAEVFKVLSVQSIVAFIMGFGWGGLGALKGAGWGMTTSIGVGVVCGVAMVWLLGLLLKAVHDLQSSGNITIEQASGLEGDVYAAIPGAGSGRGQVRVVINNRQRIFNAVSREGPIASQTRVKVMNVNSDHTLTVSPAGQAV